MTYSLFLSRQRERVLNVIFIEISCIMNYIGNDVTNNQEYQYPPVSDPDSDIFPHLDTSPPTTSSDFAFDEESDFETLPTDEEGPHNKRNIYQ
jgi:hypothetical protein